MNIKEELSKYGVSKVLDYVHKDPRKNLPKAIEFARKISPNNYVSQIDAIDEVINDPDNVFNGYIINLLENIDKDVFDTFAINFLLNAALFNGPKQEELRKEHNCNIPWCILLDFTTACNLKCTGCWASEYSHNLNLSNDEINDIINQGKELGIYFYIFTGGEPLVRKQDVIEICKKHDDCVFLMFTNATLIDDEFIDNLFELKNLVPAISIEGSEETTDSRRGKGTYKKIIKAMELLNKRNYPFGISCCYTSQNYDSITSDKFIDSMIAKGALFAWYFHFMPVGQNTTTELLPKPDQRAHVYHQIRKHRTNKPIFLMDFQNDAEFVGGCIAGGRNYLHINANGDIEPCVFIHYSDSNIREKTLLESLKSPLFMAYHDGQPFNKNMLRPCPMLENPSFLRNMVVKSKAHSTDILEKESADHLCDKCEQYASDWKPVADEIWASSK